ncbi:hypothetical protein I4I73_29920 [Pseudonocardia sp. KRD-184]|uniref:Uncharacterized protein n=1 Tax=Pseudonocardia oceani TaxID=2792013 RepID=A0ABS6UGC8_9PSEU|nr:hypothetical protein [Pseudonocardia oceani]MBW0093672.1 hypothetical protein [Pseudonocardia oceani]MBW0100203.1 hypothetical protein [Pseudonocardia oceani]MBW0112926.1 hypothetical protein [Pseudonocardia oceani]MBW0123512.1 hypothetical protein [Pseudonocardia oceani]MBW0131292.1 hypothetical protein [Pseudonocardia oceani]
MRAAAVALDECISPPGQRRLQWSPERARFRLTRTAVRAVRVATADAVHGR